MKNKAGESCRQMSILKEAILALEASEKQFRQFSNPGFVPRITPY
jgi:hypothetical protein